MFAAAGDDKQQRPAFRVTAPQYRGEIALLRHAPDDCGGLHLGSEARNVHRSWPNLGVFALIGADEYGRKGVRAARAA